MARLTELDWHSIATDQLGQLYLLDIEQRLVKPDVSSDSLYTFENSLLGDLTCMDVSDPFGPLLYFGDYQTI
ncbi:MAG: hypothetical protein HC821_02050, partial [Lewinella sp.]|nr:hypothetical protein [Lewinella sp.]